MKIQFRILVSKSLIVPILVLTGLFAVSTPAHAGNDYPWSSQCPINGWHDDGYGYYKCQCTSFVAWRLRNNNGFSLPRAIGNGGSWHIWAKNNGYVVNNTPAVGAVAEMSGHVAWVSAVHSNGTVTIEEYNWGFNKLYNTRTVPASNFWYIHFKDIVEQPVPTLQPKRPFRDFNGDGRSDLGLYNPSTGQWSIRDTGGYLVNGIKHGGPGWNAYVGDFNGDGRSDLGLYNPSTGWWSIRDTGSYTDNHVQHGGTGWVPAP
jgi:surface antigen